MLVLSIKKREGSQPAPGVSGYRPPEGESTFLRIPPLMRTPLSGRPPLLFLFRFSCCLLDRIPYTVERRCIGKVEIHQVFDAHFIK